MKRFDSQLRAARRAAAAFGVITLALFGLGSAAASGQCAGDCNSDGAVGINELISGVNIALGSAAVATCPSFDINADGSVAINELIAAVNNALSGCPSSGGTATPSPTPTPTAPTSGPTATATPTRPVSASCGNGQTEANAGETCDDGGRAEGPGDACPANCRIATCQPSGEQITADVVFDTDPSDLLVAGLTLFVRYPDGTVDVPGSNSDSAVLGAVASDFFSITPNDFNYALTAVLIDPFLSGVEAGTAVSIQFIRCQGAPLPAAAAFACTVVDASDPTPTSVTDQVSCHVVLR
ncbi:MAG: hypothetical protein ABI629_01805 [bacterium]